MPRFPDLKERLMSFWIHHCGEYANNSYAVIFEYAGLVNKPHVFGPFGTREEAVRAVERRGLTLTSLQDLQKKWCGPLEE